MKRLFSMILGLAVALSALQAQNTVTVGDVELKKGNSALVSVELTNELAFSAFQMDLTLPEGFSIPTTMNEDEEEVLDITLNASRKKSSHQLVYNVLDNGNVRIGSYSNTNATLKGTSGEIIQFRIVAADEVETGIYTARLSRLLFSTADPAVEYDLGTVDFQIAYEGDAVDIEPVVPKRSVEVNAGQYGRCVFEGEVIAPNGSYTLSEELEDGASIQLFFVPFKGYAASTMTRNGEVVAIQDNMYEESVTEDVVFADVNYVKVTDTIIVTETIVDTLVVTETVVDTLVVTETIVEVDTLVIEKVDTLFITEMEELPIPVITFEDGIVTITCEDADATILYAINGNPMEGRVYTAPFEMTEDAVISAIAVKSSEVAVFSVEGTGIAHAQARIVSQRYYGEDGIELTSPEKGITVVVVEYEDGTTRVYKMLKQ